MTQNSILEQDEATPKAKNVSVIVLESGDENTPVANNLKSRLLEESHNSPQMRNTAVHNETIPGFKQMTVKGKVQAYEDIASHSESSGEESSTRPVTFASDIVHTEQSVNKTLEQVKVTPKASPVNKYVTSPMRESPVSSSGKNLNQSVEIVDMNKEPVKSNRNRRSSKRKSVLGVRSSLSKRRSSVARHKERRSSRAALMETRARRNGSLSISDNVGQVHVQHLL